MGNQLNIIFHIPQTLSNNPVSGSDLRPVKMLESFHALGNVTEVTGSLKSRKKIINEIKKRINKGEKFDCLYSESNTMPTALCEPHHLPLRPFMDIRFLKFCRKKGIPISLFYRDIHWKFEHYKKKVKLWKRIISLPFYYYDLLSYNKTVDFLYIPSLKMVDYIPIRMKMKIESLPPGCNNNIDIRTEEVKRSDSKIRLSYVGGLGGLYQIDMFLKTITESNLNYVLQLNTRKIDWNKNKISYDKYLNNRLLISHYQSNEIDKIYNATDIFCIYIKPIEYWKFVMPIKLFEAIYFLKPVIATKGTAVGEFVEKHNIGWTIKYQEDALKDFLNNLNNNEIELKKENLREVRSINTWQERCYTVLANLKRIE